MPTPHCQGFILGHPSIPVPYSERSYRDSREGLSVHETQVRGDRDSRDSQPCNDALVRRWRLDPYMADAKIHMMLVLTSVILLSAAEAFCLTQKTQ